MKMIHLFRQVGVQRPAAQPPAGVHDGAQGREPRHGPVHHVRHAGGHQLLCKHPVQLLCKHPVQLLLQWGQFVDHDLTSTPQTR